MEGNRCRVGERQTEKGRNRITCRERQTNRDTCYSATHTHLLILIYSFTVGNHSILLRVVVDPETLGTRPCLFIMTITIRHQKFIHP